MAPEVKEVVFPNQIPIDPDQNTRAIFVHADEGLFASPSMVRSFQKVNEAYTASRAKSYFSIAASIGSIASPKLAPVDTAFIHDHRDADRKDLLVVMSPLNDGRPESNPGIITRFVLDQKGVKKSEAKPNSWRPAAKLYSDYEFGHAEGMGMPRLQIFAREAPGMSRDQRRGVAQGDMTPYGDLALEAIREASRVKHERYGTGGFERIHFFAAGMGAKALGAAVGMLESTDDYEIGGVTLMNFAMGEQSMRKLGVNYAGRKMIGEASKLILPQDYVRVRELDILTDLDKEGAEFAMRIRQIRAFANWRMVKSIMNASQGVEYIERLMENGSTITIANGFNESITAQTDQYLPVGDSRLYKTDIVGVDGKKVGQAANEHGAALAVVSNLGIYNHLYRQAA